MPNDKFFTPKRSAGPIADILFTNLTRNWPMLCRFQLIAVELKAIGRRAKTCLAPAAGKWVASLNAHHSFSDVTVSLAATYRLMRSAGVRQAGGSCAF